MEDRAIIDLFWQRSEEALTACSRCYGRYCRKIAKNILHSPEEAFGGKGIRNTALNQIEVPDRIMTAAATLDRVRAPVKS